MTSLKLKLGSYTFAIAPKDELSFAFTRSIMKLDTMGNPTYQDMGINEKKMTFSGVLDGTDAWQQAETLESIMDQGLPLTLLYGPVQRTVRLQELHPKLKRLDRVEYDISLIIVLSKSGYNAPQQPAASTTLPTKSSPAVTSTASIRQYFDKTYTVKSGDTLWKIAQRALGTSASANDIQTMVNTIAKGNGLSNPNTISVGQVLKLPSSSNLSSANSAYAARQTSIVTTAGISYLQAQENKVRFAQGRRVTAGG